MEDRESIIADILVLHMIVYCPNALLHVGAALQVNVGQRGTIDPTLIGQGSQEWAPGFNQRIASSS